MVALCVLLAGGKFIFLITSICHVCVSVSVGEAWLFVDAVLLAVYLYSSTTLAEFHSCS